MVKRCGVGFRLLGRCFGALETDSIGDDCYTTSRLAEGLFYHDWCPTVWIACMYVHHGDEVKACIEET